MEARYIMLCATARSSQQNRWIYGETTNFEVVNCRIRTQEDFVILLKLTTTQGLSTTIHDWGG